MDKHTDGQMVVQMNKWMGDLKDRCMYVCMGGWREEGIDLCKHEWMVGGWMDGLKDRWMDTCIKECRHEAGEVWTDGLTDG